MAARMMIMVVLTRVPSGARGAGLGGGGSTVTVTFIPACPEDMSVVEEEGEGRKVVGVGGGGGEGVLVVLGGGGGGMVVVDVTEGVAVVSSGGDDGSVSALCNALGISTANCTQAPSPDCLWIPLGQGSSSLYSALLRIAVIVFSSETITVLLLVIGSVVVTTTMQW